MDKTVIMIAGPTAVGKTECSISLAQNLRCDIISCDSRQMYREMKIGTAAPSLEEMGGVTHHFIGHLSIHDYYNVSRYEQDVLGFLDDYFLNKDIVIVTGGSGLYMDALCYGIDDLPSADLSLREQLTEEFREKGIEWLRERLLELDPVHYAKVDLNNHQRILKSVEVCIQTGRPYSSFLTGRTAGRNFRILKYAICRDRVELTDRIRRRTDRMMEDGFLEEASSLYPYKNVNALKTVGYRELFNYLDGLCSLEDAVEKIKVNTRRYAKRQITWLKRDGGFKWLSPADCSDTILHDLENYRLL